MSARFSSVILFICFLPLSGCNSIYAVPPAAADSAPLDTKAEKDYLLHPGDTIALTVYGEELLTNTFPIDSQGVITIPMIGAIPAEGKSARGLERAIRTSLIKKKYLSNPVVTVRVSTMRPFYIMGEVKNPGSYPYQPALDVFKAVAIAGGYTPRAAENKVLIARDNNGAKYQYNGIEKTPVLPGDSIMVRERIF